MRPLELETGYYIDSPKWSPFPLVLADNTNIPQTSVILSLAALLVSLTLSGCKPSASGPRGAESPPGLSQVEIEAKIVGFAAKMMSVDPSTISPKDDIYKDIGFDYLDPVELTSEIEDEYGLSIPNEDVEEFTTIAQFASYVKQRKSSP